MEGKTNPLKAIVAKCMDCTYDQRQEVVNCACEATCPLWPFRLGKNPYRKKREYTDEEKVVMAERLKNAHKNRAKK